MKIKKLLSLMSITACATVSNSSVVACTNPITDTNQKILVKD